MERRKAPFRLGVVGGGGPVWNRCRRLIRDEACAGGCPISGIAVLVDRQGLHGPVAADADHVAGVGHGSRNGGVVRWAVPRRCAWNSTCR